MLTNSIKPVLSSVTTHFRGGQEIMPANDTDNDDVQSMDQLVHDFNTALDETAGSNSSSRSSASRRKVRHV